MIFKSVGEDDAPQLHSAVTVSPLSLLDHNNTSGLPPFVLEPEQRLMFNIFSAKVGLKHQGISEGRIYLIPGSSQ